jgi:hypothetical protein
VRGNSGPHPNKIEVGKAYDLCLRRLGKGRNERKHAVEQLYALLKNQTGATADIHVYDHYVVAFRADAAYYFDMTEFGKLLAALKPRH